MLYFCTIIGLFLGSQSCFAMEDQPVRQRAATELTIKVFTKEERESSRKGKETSRNRSSSATQATPRSHKKNFTELYEGLGLTPRSQQERAAQEAASKSQFPGYVQQMPQIRTPRSSMVTGKKQEIKFKKHQQKSCCSIQ